MLDKAIDGQVRSFCYDCVQELNNLFRHIVNQHLEEHFPESRNHHLTSDLSHKKMIIDKLWNGGDFFSFLGAQNGTY